MDILRLMATTKVLVTLDDEVLAQIDALAMRRGRSAWIAAACQAVLRTPVSPAPSHPGTDVRAAMAAPSEADRIEAKRTVRSYSKGEQAAPHPRPK